MLILTLMLLHSLIIIVLQECFIKSQVHETTPYYTKCFTVQHTYKVAYIVHWHSY